MSFDREIGAPFTLASLPKPVSSTNGRIHAAGVCSISGIKKRKRTEIVVGLDGESVSIYSVRFFKLRPGSCMLIPFKAAKSTARDVACAPAQRLLDHCSLLDIPKRVFQVVVPALYVRLRCRVDIGRQVTAGLLPRENHGRQCADCQNLVYALKLCPSRRTRLASRPSRRVSKRGDTRCASHV